MKRFLFLACIVMLGWSTNIFCSILQSQVSLLQYEFQKFEALDKKESELRKPIIEANINYLTNSIRLKIKKQEVRLEKIKEQIQSSNISQSDEESGEFPQEKLSKKYWKKFYSTNKKIEMLNEVLFVVEQLKDKLTN